MNQERWGKIKQIYHSALELEPGRRQQFLKEACAGDESLLKEVISLLAQEAKSQGLFEGPAFDAVVRLLAEDERHRPEQQNLRAIHFSTIASRKRSAKGAWEWSTVPTMNIFYATSLSRSCRKALSEMNLPANASARKHSCSPN